DGDKIAVVPNFTTFVANHNMSKRNGKVLFVGRLSSEKGYDILFSAASKLPTVDFTVAGGCSSQADLSGKPHNVTLLGAVDRKRLIELYSTHSLLAITSRCYEAFPLTILEAAMNHCPVIAPNLGAMKSIIKDNETGALFAPFSSDDLAEKIDLLLKDTITAEKLAARSYEVCMKLYSPENYYNSVVSLISLIEQPLHQK
ncbi:MAG: glycosyltransferase family 4 protein, partial [Rikenellaceae bacterium]